MYDSLRVKHNPKAGREGKRGPERTNTSTTLQASESRMARRKTHLLTLPAGKEQRAERAYVYPRLSLFVRVPVRSVSPLVQFGRRLRRILVVGSPGMIVSHHISFSNR